MTGSSDDASFVKLGRGGLFKPPLGGESFFSGGASPAGGLGWLLGGELVASASRMVERFYLVSVLRLVLAILSCFCSVTYSLFDSSIAFLFKKVTIP